MRLHHTPLIAYSIVAIQTFAFAQPSPGGYLSAAEKQERCRTDGELSQSFFGAKPETILAAFDDAKEKVRTKKLSKKKADDFRFLVYSGMSASSPQDAYMRGWAACMDGKYNYK